MQYRPLGTTGLDVSLICLGTMLWGAQNSQEDAFAQMDYAVSQGVNFFDTAEMYAVPPRAETYGKSEEIIGNWFQARRNRSEIILASKIVGPGAERFSHIRGGRTRFTREHIVKAVDDSLRRLRTDYIDLYQLHWPDRNTNIFGQRGYHHVLDEEMTLPLETLQILADQVKLGKIRYIGLSNETAWGLMKFLHLSEMHNLPGIHAIQNAYNLLNRSFEASLAECAVREHCGLLAYSPLAAGFLSGKYLHGALPENSRHKLWRGVARYDTPQGHLATERYIKIAKKYGLSPVHMALAFVNRQTFVTANIIGASTMEQLRHNIAAWDINLPAEAVADIEAVHQEIPDPCV